MNPPDAKKQYRLGIIAASITAIGTLLSGPLAFLAVSSINPQPAWTTPRVFVENFHPIQSVTFYFGFLLMGGSILMIAFIHHQKKDEKTLLALVFTAIAGGFIFFNYFTEATYVPALVRNYTPDLDPIIRIFAATNPFSLFWVIEMWGYGFLGLGSILVIHYFSKDGLEGWTRIMFLINGVISIIGAFYTSLDLEWVLTTAGLISYGLWNLLYFALAVMFLFVLLRRRSRTA
jgi:hypothetical protein